MGCCTPKGPEYPILGYLGFHARNRYRMFVYLHPQGKASHRLREGRLRFAARRFDEDIEESAWVCYKAGFECYQAGARLI